MTKAYSKNNRTLRLTGQESEHYANLCAIQPPFEADSFIKGDVFEVAAKLQPQSVDLLIIDPPYNLDKKFGETQFRKMGDAAYYIFTRNWVKALLPVLKQNASVYACCDWKSSLTIGKLLDEFLTVRNRITWQREKGRGSASNWKNSMEDIWFATVSGDYTFNADAVKQRKKVLAPYKTDGRPKDWVEHNSGNYRDTYASNFWDDITVPFWSMPENTEHPTQKPEKLYAKLILASSNDGDLVLEPFAGTGTACVTARKLGRQFIGIEAERGYCALAQKRLELALNDKAIQGYEDGVFYDRNMQAKK